MHGGKTPKGLASVHTKTGRYSKDLPTRLLARFEESEHDPDLMSLRQEVRLIDVLLHDDIQRLDSGENGESWVMVRKATDALALAMNSNDPKVKTKGPVALQTIREIIDKRIAHYATLEEIRLKVEQRRKLVETEAKITLAGEQAISVEKAMLLVGAIAGILKARVTDANILALIQADIGQLIHAQETTG